jgi:tetratricopeptide (TPR) repeat protein
VKNKGISYFFILAACLPAVSARENSAQSLHVTPHELLPEQKIVVESKGEPQWKRMWDAARESALQGDFEESVRLYRALLMLKDNLQEARWELAKLMMYLKRWGEAAELLEFLLGAEPENIPYVSSLGKVMLEMAQYERAVDLFQKVYAVNPSDQTALAGLVEALSKLGKRDDALTYLEQLSRQEPTNRGIRRYLAFLFYDAGSFEKARAHFTILARSEDVESDVLYKTAKTYENLGLEEQAAFYWERMLAREPENIDAHLYLAKYYEKEGQFEKSLSHFKAVLDTHPEDTASFVRIGENYEKAGEYEKALLYYEKYLEKYPNDIDVQRRVVSSYAALGRKKQTLTPLDQYVSPESSEIKEELKKTIRKYTASGRYLDALPLYRKLLELSPEDPEILEALAYDLLAIGENEGEISIIRHLSKIVPDNIDIYRAMAELLKRLERDEELLAVLLKILEFDPGDNATRQKIAIIYLQRGELEKSQRYFAELPDSSCSSAECLQARALLAERLDCPEQGLRYYETLLKEYPDRYDARIRAVYLAAEMGLLDTAVYHAGYLQDMASGHENLELKILLADVYKKSGYFNKAVERYRHIIEEIGLQKDMEKSIFRIHSWLGIAESYKESGLFYEAEQTLRSALVAEEKRQPLLAALFRLSLETGNLPLAEIWLQALDNEMEKEDQLDKAMHPDIIRKRLLLHAESHAAAGDYSQALEQLEDAMKLQGQPGEWDDFFFHGAPDFSVRLKRAEYLMLGGDTEAAEEALEALRNDYGARAELFVLREQVYRSARQGEKAKRLADETRIYANQDAGRQLVLAELFNEYNDPERQLEMAGEAAAHLPDSLIAKRLLVDAKLGSAGYQEALEELQQFQRNYPENTWFLIRKVELLAKIGNFQDALTAGDVILVEDPERKDILLLKARILWEVNRWKESVAIYESVVEPSVEDILGSRIQELAVVLEPAQSKRSLWKVITFSEGKPLSLAEVVMSPLHAVDFSAGSQAVNSVAAPEYALYRWQKRFGQELAVRRAVMRREYYHAAYLLENVLEQYGSNDFLLYDLAGLYSKLERLSDEGRIYRVLETQNANFPGLAEAAQRNSLKRRPHTFISYAMQEDDGWDGYKAVKRELVTGGGWYYQSTSQRWNIDISRIGYRSTEIADQSVWSLRTMATFDAKITQAFNLSLGGGIENLGNGYGNNFLYSAMITGRLADEMRAVVSVKQDVTADTIASLERGIRRKDYKLELMFDLFPRILLGGYYDFIDFSDANWINNYTFWASYIFLPEPTLFKISYNYDFYDAREGPNPGIPSDDGFALDDHPYWSPVNYWITKFSFYFKHQLSNDALARGIPSYYTIEYSLGYDASDNDFYELKGSFNLELAKRYILSASYGFVDQDVYRHEEALFSVTYRW